jgi:hypothetical protein
VGKEIAMRFCKNDIVTHCDFGAVYGVVDEVLELLGAYWIKADDKTYYIEDSDKRLTWFFNEDKPTNKPNS